jgi:glycosyltransferase involved in cell wall biosynthesis
MEVSSNPETNERVSDSGIDESVTVVVTTFNDEAYLREALLSIFAQDRLPDEVIVVDDGSIVSPIPILKEFPEATLLRKSNGGLSSARNLGLYRARSHYICFLDADDRLEPNAIASGVACFAGSPDVAMVYGGHRRIHADGRPAGSDNYEAVSDNPYTDLLSGNHIGMHATVLYRREVLLALGGFDESLRRCEDYDLYLRIARQFAIASHSDIIAEYRWHGQNMSSNAEEMLEAVLQVHSRYHGQNSAQRKAWRAGRQFWKAWYRQGYLEWIGQAGKSPWKSSIKGIARSTVRRMKNRYRNGRLHAVVARVLGSWPPPVGWVNFGRLSTAIPISQNFGWDRGTAVDRYYIEKFLAENASDITGRVLEVADDAYSRRFGSNISTQDILHVDPHHAKATLHGDLAQPGVIPENAFDCIVLTQTLQLIFELEQAVRYLHASLKPDGILLLTVPGISAIDRGEWGESWCWAFTPTSIRRLFQRSFPSDALEIEAHGNVFAATAFLQGAALEEVDQSKLDIHDAAYPVIITLRARKN